jgi:undecaprenyl diphosphate synthase
MATGTKAQVINKSDVKGGDGTVPVHLGLILDGNRRWAADQGLPSLEGHRRGYENLKTIAEAAFNRGVKFVSAFVFSTENWNRAKEEVAYLMNLLTWVVNHEVVEMNKKNIKVVFLGKEQPLSQKNLKLIHRAEEMTKCNTGGTLALCLNYGGQTEITEAVQSMIETGVKSEDVTPELIRQYLYHPEIPDVDYVIRTSGEQRTSGFMLWRAAYAEMCFVKKYWPAFNASDLDSALAHYGQRVRRFGQ